MTPDEAWDALSEDFRRNHGTTHWSTLLARHRPRIDSALVAPRSVETAGLREALRTVEDAIDATPDSDEWRAFMLVERAALSSAAPSPEGPTQRIYAAIRAAIVQPDANLDTAYVPWRAIKAAFMDAAAPSPEGLDGRLFDLLDKSLTRYLMDLGVKDKATAQTVLRGVASSILARLAAPRSVPARLTGLDGIGNEWTAGIEPRPRSVETAGLPHFQSVDPEALCPQDGFPSWAHDPAQAVLMARSVETAGLDVERLRKALVDVALGRGSIWTEGNTETLRAWEDIAEEIAAEYQRLSDGDTAASRSGETAGEARS